MFSFCWGVRSLWHSYTTPNAPWPSTSPRQNSCAGTLVRYEKIGRTVPLSFERLAEYGWKPHRYVLVPNKPITGLNLLLCVWKTEGYGFIEIYISNSTISTVFRQPLIIVCALCSTVAITITVTGAVTPTPTVTMACCQVLYRCFNQTSTLYTAYFGTGLVGSLMGT